MIGRLRCLVMSHERCKHNAHWDGTHYVSTCVHCGVGMYRTRDKDRSWQVDRRKAPRAAA